MNMYLQVARKKFLCQLLVLFALLGGIDPALATGPDPALSSKLHAALAKFAIENSISDEQLRFLLNDAMLNSHVMSMGGVGGVDRNTYVVIDKGRNTVITRGRRRWIGDSSNKTQLVVVGDKGVLWSSSVLSASSLKVILFMPSEIHFVDLYNGLGGRFARDNSR